MPDAIQISIFALSVSIASFCLSFYSVRRDRSRIKAICSIRAHERTGEYSSIFVSISNIGRRTLTLRLLRGIYENGKSGGIVLSQEGVKLEEGMFYETEFGKFDGIMVNGDELSPLIDIYIEDSSGKSYKIKNSRRVIKLLKQSKHPFGVRTHG